MRSHDEQARAGFLAAIARVWREEGWGGITLRLRLRLGLGWPAAHPRPLPRPRLIEAAGRSSESIAA